MGPNLSQPQYQYQKLQQKADRLAQQIVSGEPISDEVEHQWAVLCLAALSGAINLDEHAERIMTLRALEGFVDE